MFGRSPIRKVAVGGATVDAVQAVIVVVKASAPIAVRRR